VVQRAGVVYVVGDVARPAGFLMDSDGLTVLQAVALAAGTNKTAKLNGAKIIRHTPKGLVERPIQLKKILRAKAQDDDIPMKEIPLSACRHSEGLFGPEESRV
jgi:polysaccharide export outer membrane protein